MKFSKGDHVKLPRHLGEATGVVDYVNTYSGRICVLIEGWPSGHEPRVFISADELALLVPPEPPNIGATFWPSTLLGHCYAKMESKHAATGEHFWRRLTERKAGSDFAPLYATWKELHGKATHEQV